MSSSARNSKRNSFVSAFSPVTKPSPRFGSPRFESQQSFNSYEVAQQQQHHQRQSQSQSQSQSLYPDQPNMTMYQQHPNSPRIIIDSDPTVPDFHDIPMSQNKTCNYKMKLVIVGDGAVGKSCLLISYSLNQFPEIYVPTVFENYVRTVMSPSGKSIELALWDTAGQEEYDRLRPLSYPEADMILICFALDNLTSLMNVKEIWFPEVSHYCPGIPVILVGTKADLENKSGSLEYDTDHGTGTNSYNDIPEQLPLQIATEIGAIAYLKCSAKTMFNTRTVFNFALNHFQKHMEMQEQIQKSQSSSSRKRFSKRFGSNGSNGGSNGFGSAHGSGNYNHLRTGSNTSNSRRGHLKNTSYDSTILLDQPLTEDKYELNPYGDFGGGGYGGSGKPSHDTYSGNGEFDFIKEHEKRYKKKNKKCVIL